MFARRLRLRTGRVARLPLAVWKRLRLAALSLPGLASPTLAFPRLSYAQLAYLTCLFVFERSNIRRPLKKIKVRFFLSPSFFLGSFYFFPKSQVRSTSFVANVFFQNSQEKKLITKYKIS